MYLDIVELVLKNPSTFGEEREVLSLYQGD